MSKRLLLLVLLGLWAANTLVWTSRVAAIQAAALDQLDLLVDVRYELLRNYVEQPDEQKMARAAVKGMVDSLGDPFTVYLAPDDLNNFDRAVRGSFSGIGAEIDVVDDRPVVVSPLEDSPAWKAGVMAGDVILEIDGADTKGMKVSDTVTKLTGEEGTAVKLKVRHESGQESEITITRARISVPTVKGFRRVGDGHWDYLIDPVNRIGYLRVSQFTGRTAEDIEAVLKSLVEKNVAGIIMDLRFNPGGLLESAVAVSDMFLEGDKRIVRVAGRAVPERIETSTPPTLVPMTVPLVLLVNDSSASASEVVAGALGDNERAQIIGTRSFGKGSVQQVLKLDDELGALKVTNAYYYGPSNRTIHRREGAEVWGVDPKDGFYVPMAPEQNRRMLEIRRKGDVLRPVNGEAANAPAVTPDWVREQLADLQLAAGLQAVLGKVQSGDWPRVGKDGVAIEARRAQLTTLQRQRDTLQQRLDELNTQVAKLETDLNGDGK